MPFPIFSPTTNTPNPITPRSARNNDARHTPGRIHSPPYACRPQRCPRWNTNPLTPPLPPSNFTNSITPRSPGPVCWCCCYAYARRRGGHSPPARRWKSHSPPARRWKPCLCPARRWKSHLSSSPCRRWVVGVPKPTVARSRGRRWVGVPMGCTCRTDFDRACLNFFVKRRILEIR